MPGPLMDRNDQYAAAPQKQFPSNRMANHTYVSGTNAYALDPAGSVITALQVYAYEGSDPIERTSEVTYLDTIQAPGNTLAYIVRLYEDPAHAGTWLEEALIPAEYYVATYVGDIYDAASYRILKQYSIQWQAPTSPDGLVDWQYPLGTPAAHIKKSELPIAAHPTTGPYKPPVKAGFKYRAYLDGITNATGATLANSGAFIDVTNCEPAPRPGPMIVHYQSMDGKLLDKG